MNRILNTVTTAVDEVTTQIIVKSDGLLDVGNELNTEFQAFVRNGAVTIFLLAFVIICWRKGWAVAGFLGGLFIAGLGYFGVNGGFELMGNLLKQTVGG